MLKQNSKYLNSFQAILDLICVLGSFFLSWHLKFESGIFAHEPHLDLISYAKILIYVLPAFIMLQYIFGLYSPGRTKTAYIEIYSVSKSSVVLFVFIMCVLFFMKEFDISRIFIILFSFFIFIFSATQRTLIKVLLRSIRKKGYNIKHVLIIGYTPQTKNYLKAINKNKSLGYKPFGILDNKIAFDTSFLGARVIGRIEDLSEILTNNFLDEIVIAISLEDYIHMGYILDCCEKNGIKSVIIPSYYDYIPAKPQIDEIDDIPMINTRYIPLDNMIYSFVKRIFDIAISCLLLLLFSPLFLFIAILIKLTSKGSILFKQERVGYNRKPFFMYKFRTMENSCDSGGWTVENDPRRTKIGAWLRRLSLDEFPQLYNVLKGDMSLVGPRPEQKTFVEEFKDKISKYMVKHRVRPGITGWAQVNGWRGNTSIEERIKHDIYYIENWSLLFDLKILLKTIGFGKNAY